MAVAPNATEMAAAISYCLVASSHPISPRSSMKGVGLSNVAMLVNKGGTDLFIGEVEEPRERGGGGASA